MARKVVSRKAKAAEAEAASALESAAPKKKATRKAAPRKAKVAEDVRKKLYWGVFSQNSKRVAVFEFDQKDEAVARAEELSKGGKNPHFIQKVKEEIQLED